MSTPTEAPARNLVLCFDGTGDWVGSDETNVALLFLNLVRDDDQVAFYDGGVGTLTNPQALAAFQRTALRALDLGLATGIREKTLNGYLFLVRYYRPGDRIHLFGFSRGAFTARLVAAMVHCFGILRPEHENIAPYLWQTLESIPPGRRANEAESPIGEFERTAAHLKKEFANGAVEIDFMGLFDTVSSVGVIRRFNVYPHTDRNPSVRRVCHAVSIDEQRNVFPETLFNPKQPGLTEVWFPGVHRDLVGGDPNVGRRIADETLVWIEAEARLAGVRFRGVTVPGTDPPAPDYPPYDPYVPLGLYPLKMFVKRASGFRFLWPDFRHVRVMPERALVHEIVRTLQAQGRYEPVNLVKSHRWYPQDAALPRDDRFALPPAVPRLSEAVAIAVGTALMVLLLNHALADPLGTPWPAWTGKATFGIAVGFFAGQVLHRRATELVLTLLGLVVLVAYAVVAWCLGWTACWGALAAGGLVTLAGQCPGLPTLPAQRALPYVLWAWVGARIIAFVLDRLDLSPSLQSPLLALAGLAVLFDLVAERGRVRAAEADADRRRTALMPVEAARRSA